MDARETVIGQYKFAHGVLLQVIGLATPETMHTKLPGSNIDTIASTFAHIVFAEDSIVNGMALGGAPVFVSGGWAGKTGTDMPQSPRQNHEWASSVKLDLARFTPYAQAVFASTEEMIAKATDTQLNETKQGPLGPSSVFGLISGLGLYHMVEHSGEIAALLGVQGRKGLPF